MFPADVAVSVGTGPRDGYVGTVNGTDDAQKAASSFKSVSNCTVLSSIGPGYVSRHDGRFCDQVAKIP